MCPWKALLHLVQGNPIGSSWCSVSRLLYDLFLSPTLHLILQWEMSLHVFLMFESSSCLIAHFIFNGRKETTRTHFLVLLSRHQSRWLTFTGGSGDEHVLIHTGILCVLWYVFLPFQPEGIFLIWSVLKTSSLSWLR